MSFLDSLLNKKNNTILIDEYYKKERYYWSSIRSVLSFNDRQCNCCKCYDIDIDVDTENEFKNTYKHKYTCINEYYDNQENHKDHKDQYLHSQDSQCYTYCKCTCLYPIVGNNVIMLSYSQIQTIIYYMKDDGYIIDTNKDINYQSNYHHQYVIEQSSLNDFIINLFKLDRTVILNNYNEYMINVYANTLNFIRTMSGNTSLVYE